MKILGVIGGPEIIIILLVVIVLFGGKKIPELMKGLGKGVKEYKKAINGMDDDNEPAPHANETAEQPTSGHEANE